MKNLPAFIVTCLLASLELSAVTYTQVISLRSGWNAVWLEVDPVNENGESLPVEEVFIDTAVSAVATLRLPAGTSEFISETTDKYYNDERWLTWRRNSKLGEQTLSLVRGYQAYLIFAESDIQVSVTGEAWHSLFDWSEDAYNLVGFQLTSGVTFAQFFEDVSDVFPTSRMFRLTASGQWEGISGSDSMEPNVAYWIYCDGPTSFAGPIRFDFGSIRELDFGSGAGDFDITDPLGNGADTISVLREDIVFSNVSSQPQQLIIEKVTPATSAQSAYTDELKIYEIESDPETLSYNVGQNDQLTSVSFDIASGDTDFVVLGAHRDWSSSLSERENLYRVIVGNNLYYWLPMSAGNSSISDASPGGADSAYAGLWVGEVTFKEVTSISEAGHPWADAISAYPMRLILHVDSAGQPALLASVTLMQQETAADDEVGELVLVVDQNKIPYFEGVEERNGKLVGKRIETASYDMPRNNDPAVQAGLEDELLDTFQDEIHQASDLTAGHVLRYINAQTSRPIDLVEEYELSWPLEGGVGPGAITQTSANAPLVLDSFHRSNPFRHVFHKKHAVGYAIERAILVQFDDRFQSGLLTGVYEETVEGLAAFPISIRGALRLERISEISDIN
ncbi:hypothetical protein [Cerasicoccus frondis]|uniref:hypothetical protein n=1 Tax=Cerasicoccus frondis TaxID=490090 RepID=UPI0028527382|nr:hypothetical protein [Cerasicoccus frondis]